MREFRVVFIPMSGNIAICQRLPVVESTICRAVIVVVEITEVLAFKGFPVVEGEIKPIGDLRERRDGVAGTHRVLIGCFLVGFYLHALDLGLVQVFGKEEKIDALDSLRRLERYLEKNLRTELVADLRLDVLNGCICLGKCGLG